MLVCPKSFSTNDRAAFPLVEERKKKGDDEEIMLCYSILPGG